MADKVLPRLKIKKVENRLDDRNKFLAKYLGLAFEQGKISSLKKDGMMEWTIDLVNIVLSDIKEILLVGYDSLE